MLIQLTIITVCRNAESTIGETLASIAKQKTPEVEYIVIDGASTDGTLAELSRYPGLADCINSEGDRGIYDAMNKGAALAQGLYVCYLNADDTYLPNAVNSILLHIATYPEVDMFYGDWIGVGPRNTAVYRKAQLKLGWRYQLCHQAIIVRRELLGTRPFDEHYRICADFDAIQKWISERASTRHIPEALVRFSEVGVSNTAVRRACLESLKIATQRLGLLNSWRFCVMTLLHLFRVEANLYYNERSEWLRDA